MDGPPRYDPEWLRHYAHPLALCRRGSGQKLIHELGLCTPQEWANSMRQVRNAKARNEYWRRLGYPNLVRARAAKREAERRRRLLGLRARDHSLDHVLEYAAKLIPPATVESRVLQDNRPIVRVAAQSVPLRVLLRRL